MDLGQFLLWLISGGGALIASTWILGQIPGYASLVEKVKQWIFFSVACILAIGAFLVSHYVPAATLTAIEPYFLIVAGIFIVVFLNKMYTRLANVDKQLTEFKATFLASKKK